LADEEALVFQCQMGGRIWKGAAGMYRRSEGRTRGLGVGGAEVFDGDAEMAALQNQKRRLEERFTYLPQTFVQLRCVLVWNTGVHQPQQPPRFHHAIKPGQEDISDADGRDSSMDTSVSTEQVHHKKPHAIRDYVMDRGDGFIGLTKGTRAGVSIGLIKTHRSGRLMPQIRT
jgi:hypothetical protein